MKKGLKKFIKFLIIRELPFIVYFYYLKEVLNIKWKSLDSITASFLQISDKKFRLIVNILTYFFFKKKKIISFIKTLL